jgi:hypothetical protein
MQRESTPRPWNDQAAGFHRPPFSRGRTAALSRDRIKAISFLVSYILRVAFVAQKLVASRQQAKRTARPGPVRDPLICLVPLCEDPCARRGTPPAPASSSSYRSSPIGWTSQKQGFVRRYQPATRAAPAEAHRPRRGRRRRRRRRRGRRPASSPHHRGPGRAGPEDRSHAGLVIV